MTDRILAGRAVVAKWLAGQLEKTVKGIRAELEPMMEPGEKTTAQLPDGTRIGKVRRNEASRSATVTDYAALLAWVAEHRPDEIEVTESVRSSFIGVLKRQCEKHGHAFDRVTGEIIPGIEMKTGSSAYVPEWDDDDEIESLLRSRIGEFLTTDYLQLPPANGDGTPPEESP